MHKNREKEMVVLGILTALAVLLSYVLAIQRLPSASCPWLWQGPSMGHGKRGWWGRWIT